MQTFLPYADFARSAACLDRQRLGKQRVECAQILSAIHRIENGESKVPWGNHPSVKMWVGSKNWLAGYMNVIVFEWERRGYKNNLILPDFRYWEDEKPKWLGDEAFHAAHRAALLFKNPGHYSQFGWEEKPELNYIWPVK